jgi:hypothetical protein
LHIIHFDKCGNNVGFTCLHRNGLSYAAGRDFGIRYL